MRIPIRAYTVEICDERTHQMMEDTIVLTKDQLRAGAMLNLDDEAVIKRIYNRKGYRVTAIGSPHKLEIDVDLTVLYEEYMRINVMEVDTIGVG